MDTQMLIGSRLRGGDGDAGERPQPQDRREHHCICRKPRTAQIDARRRGRREGVRLLVAHDARRSAPPIS